MKSRFFKVALFGCMLLAGFPAAAQWTWSPQTGRWINLKRLPKETPELQIEYARSLLLSGDKRRALRETHKFEQFYRDSEFADDNLFLRGEIQQASGNTMDAARTFQSVVTAYPGSNLYNEAIERQYQIGDEYYEQGQKRMQKMWRPMRKKPLKRAVTVYSMVIENQPFTPQAAQAQYKVGLAHFARKDYSMAVDDFNRVVEDYPDSEWADDARFGLVEANYGRSRPAEYDQSYSEATIKSIKNFTDLYPSDARAAELDAKRQEMRDRIAKQRMQTARFYEKRREFASARIYYEIVASDFTDTEFAAEAQQWLDEHPGVPSVRARYADRTNPVKE